MKQLTHVRNLIYGQPWAIRPEMLNFIAEVVETNLAGEVMPGAPMMDAEPPKVERINGVDIIPIIGPITRRANLFSQISGATSIDILSQQFKQALAGDSKAILFSIDSPGGSVMGVQELASQIFNAARNPDVSKPIITLTDGMMASAAYWIGSQANEVYTTEAAAVGSIGIVAKIDDTSRAERNAGTDSTVLSTNELKSTGHMPMTPAQMQDIRRSMDTYFEMFKGSVGRARQTMMREAGVDLNALATGQTWIGAEAVKLGLCDGVSTFDDIIEQYGDKEN